MDFSRDMSVSLEPHVCTREAKYGVEDIDVGMYRVYVHYYMFFQHNGKLMVGYLSNGIFQPTPEFNRAELTDDHRTWIKEKTFEELAKLQA